MYNEENWYAASVDLFTLYIELAHHDDAAMILVSMAGLYLKVGYPNDYLVVLQAQLDLEQGDIAAAWEGISFMVESAVTVSETPDETVLTLVDLAKQESKRKSYATAAMLYASASRVSDSFQEPNVIGPEGGSLDDVLFEPPLGLLHLLTQKYERERASGRGDDTGWRAMCRIAPDLQRLDELLSIDLPPPTSLTQKVLDYVQAICTDSDTAEPAEP